MLILTDHVKRRITETNLLLCLGLIFINFAEMTRVIDVQSTPNPLARKFVLDKSQEGDAISFNSIEDAKDNFSIRCLFGVEYVESAFVYKNFVAVSIGNEGDWDILIPEISMLIDEYFDDFGSAESTKEIPTPTTEEDIPFPEDFTKLEPLDQKAHVELILDKKVRPGLGRDGGGINLIAIHNLLIEVEYLGACTSCPSSESQTLGFIQQTFQRHAHPAIMVKLIQGTTNDP